MKHRVQHSLRPEVARKVTDHALQAYQTRFPDYAPTVTWTGERTAEVAFRAKGVTLKGSFELEDSAIAMEMEVPLLLRPFRQKALDVVEREIKEWIDRAARGELA